MHIEYEEFETIEDIFMYMSSVAPPMKNTMPISSYKNHVFAFIPLDNRQEIFTCLYMLKVFSIPIFWSLM